MIWYQLLIAVGVGMMGVLLAVLLGGWLVFKAETIMMPTPMMSTGRRKKGEPQSYMPDGFGVEDVQKHVLDEELSPAASRLRAQKADVPDVPDKKSIMSIVRGK